MPPGPNLSPNFLYQHSIYLQDMCQEYRPNHGPAHQWHQDPRYPFWYPPGCVPMPLLMNLPHSPTHPHLPPNKLRRHKPCQQQQQPQPQRQQPQPQPQPPPKPKSPPPFQPSQPQMAQRSPSRARSQSRSRLARCETRSQSPPPARAARSQSRNPQPAPRSPSRSRSRPRREDADRRTVLKNIANETIEAFNNGKVDVSITQQHTQLFLEDSQELADWRRSRPHNPIHNSKIDVLPLTTLQGARHLNSNPHPEQKIGVLNFASATSPGGGFLNGARAQEESIARSSSLYASLCTDTAEPFYALHAGKGGHSGFYTHAMIYSPNVHLFRDDHGGWTDPLPVDIVTSPAVNAGKVRKRYYPGKRLEVKIELVMQERMARVLALFELKGATSLVLGSFGTGVFQNDVGVVARIWRDLLLKRDARFKSSFREVVFCIPDAKTRGVFEGALMSRDGVRGRSPHLPAHGDGGDGP